MISSKYAIIFGDETFMRVAVRLHMNLMLFYYFDPFLLSFFIFQHNLNFGSRPLYLIVPQYIF